MTGLEVTAVEKKGPAGWALQPVSFTVERQQRIAIIGETGSGKSTLLRIIGGWDQASAGEVRFEGEKVPGIDEKLLPGHPGIAYLSQQYSLPQHLRVEQVLEYANVGTPAEGEAIIALCQVTQLLKRKTAQLSGGEQQRVALCRQLLGQPRLLLLGEPFSNLDRSHKDIIKTVLRSTSERLSLTCILISHDPLDVLSWADRLLVLKQGELLQEGSPEAVYRQPINAYVGGLVGRCNLLKASDLVNLAGLFKNGAPATDSMIRPEQLSLHRDRSGVPCTVRAIYFMGSDYEVEVSIKQTRLFVKTTKVNF